MTLDLSAVDDIFATEFAQGRSPGLVYAVVRDGEVLHAHGLGTTTWGAETPPAVSSVHRIASMTKSFTATAVLLLRDRGALRLDDPVSAYVPELEGFRLAPDAPDLTIRHLLTMSGGLLTDDPWGDRNESQTAAELGQLLAGGFTVGAVPGTRFEYSNLGYAILGRVVDSLTGGDGGYRRFVLEAVTGPLGMAATRYDVREVGPDLVVGHHRRGDEWTVEPEVLPGTFSAMGGLHSTLTDLARWVGGFTDAFRRPDAPHPLSAASRREMQQLQRFIGVSGAASVDVPVGGAALAATAAGYGFGLFVEHHSDHGDVVHHAGGYPGYGSHMRWHPETGLGVVGLANGTYAAPGAACRDALRALVADERTSALPPVASPEIVAAVTAKVGSTAEPFTDDLFSANVPLDVPEPERLEQLAAARGLVGAPTAPAAEPYADGLGAAAWSVPAERGRYDLEIKVAPTRQRAVQSLKVTAVPHAPDALTSAATRALAGDVGELVLGDDLDTDAFRRAAAVAHGLGGTPTIAGVLAGDGDASATFAVRAGTTWWRLEITGADPVTALALTAVPTSEHPRLAHRFSG
ncbi:serine hydrolase [Nocardioides sp. CER19]|uniref:serine hydrolase n=1 Tax=Nocardioides sp. CER19 TaxID=3038538 RepID=UPI00244C6FC5|nr:serine hydrolase [Nocardioides sp. CER19]MDH2415490.1 serine hydrolase [Nocardioides sp. CER19]